MVMPQNVMLERREREKGIKELESLDFGGKGGKSLGILNADREKRERGNVREKDGGLYHDRSSTSREHEWGGHAAIP